VRQEGFKRAVERVADALLERKTLTGKEVTAVVGGGSVSEEPVYQYLSGRKAECSRLFGL